MAKLGDICEIVSGTTPKTGVSEFWDGDINWITPAELEPVFIAGEYRIGEGFSRWSRQIFAGILDVFQENLTQNSGKRPDKMVFHGCEYRFLHDDTTIIYDSQRKITEKAVQSGGLRPFPAGTVILSSRAPIGKVAIAGVEMYCNQGFKNLICSERIYNKYLFWFLKSKTDYLNSLGRGATFKEISKSIVADIDIPLPARETQQYISILLDKVSDLIALRKQQLDKLDELVKARFMELFGDPETNTKGWSISNMCNLCSVGSSKRIYQSEQSSAGILFWRVSDLTNSK